MVEPNGIMGGHDGHLVTQPQPHSQILTLCSRAARNLGLELRSKHGHKTQPTSNQVLIKKKDFEIMHLNVRLIIKDDKNSP